MAAKQNTSTQEIWKPIPECPGYEASNRGRVRSLDRWIKQKSMLNGAERRFWKGRILRAATGGTSNYLTVRLNGHTTRVHQAVLAAFTGPKPKGMICCHNNGNKLDNRLENLRYDTYRSNIMDRLLHGTHNRGEQHGMHKLSDADIRAILQAASEWRHSIARRYSVTESCIRQILAFKRRSYGGKDSYSEDLRL